MKVRFREADQTADVVIRPDRIEGVVLFGSGGLFFLDGELESNAEWIIGADDFADEWDLVRASDEERAQLRAAGFRV